MNLQVPPALVLGIVLASIYASLFQVWKGRTLRDYLRYLIAGWIGFALGQWLGDIWSITILEIGQVHAVSATLGAWLILLIAHRL